MRAIETDRCKDRSFSEGRSALRLAMLLLSVAAFAPGRGKGRGISPPSDPGEGTLAVTTNDGKEKRPLIAELIITLPLRLSAGLQKEKKNLKTKAAWRLFCLTTAV